MPTYNGSCHCGAVRYAVSMDPVTSAIACNCSMCRRAGTLLTFVPAASFDLEHGSDALASYKFNKHVVDHAFCTTCGIKSFARGKKADGTPTIAINVRCLDGVDVDQLDVKHYDGASH